MKRTRAPGRRGDRVRISVRGAVSTAWALLVLVPMWGCTLATTPLPPPSAPTDLPPPSSERPLPGADRAEPGTRGDGAERGGAPDRGEVEPERLPGASGLPAAGTPATDAPPAGATGALAAAAAVPRATGTRVLRPGETHPLPATLPDEVRALWVVRTALEHPDSVRAIVARAEAGGFNTLLVQVRGRGDAWYRSSLEPRPLQLLHLPESYDPLALLLAEARPRGLAVHAWVNVHLVASHDLLPVDPGHLVNAHPEWLALPVDLAGPLAGTDPRDPAWLGALVDWSRRNADQVEGLYSSPANPAVRAHLVRVVEELVRRYPLDGLHLDYVRHPSDRFDHSPGALHAFEGWLATHPGVGAAGLRGVTNGGGGTVRDLPAAFPREWTRFRQEALTDLVSELRAVVDRVDPGMLLSAAVFADLVTARDHRFQPWDAWLEAGVVDVVAPMIYTPDDDRFARQLLAATGVAGPRRVWAGLGVYQDTFVGAVTKAQVARLAGAGGLALFSYDWAVGPEGSRVAGTGPGGYLLRWGREGWEVR